MMADPAARRGVMRSMESFISPACYQTATAAWRAAVSAVEQHGDWVDSVSDQSSVGSAFGQRKRPFRELRGFGFTISNPRSRVVLSDARRLNLPFLFANFIWTISGSNQLEMINCYNRRGACFSDDGVTLESAFGAKLFGRQPAQFTLVSELLARDPTTRRATINLFDSAALEKRSKDVSCALALQFLIRDGRLDCMTFMRSQSVAMVMPYDLFLFTMIHEAMSSKLGVPLGRYTHICASLHYYNDEASAVENILRESEYVAESAMPVMPPFSDDARHNIVSAERSVRHMLSSDSNILPKHLRTPLTQAHLEPYWISLFEAFFGDGIAQANTYRTKARSLLH